MNVRGDRRVKLLATVSVWLLVLALFTLVVAGQARGYEISLYEALPTPFWVFLVGAVFAAQAGLLARAFDPAARSRLWVILFGALVLATVTLLLLPYIRGYPVYGRADVLSHVGFARSIDSFGTASNRELYPTDIYPNIHLLVLALSYATGVDPLHVINSIAPFVTFVSIGGFYLLLAEVYERRRPAIAGAAIVALPIGATAHINTSPYAQSLLLVPLVLYLFLHGQRTGSTGIRVALVVALVSLVLYHPLTAFFVLFVFVAYVLTGLLGFSADARSPAVAGYVTISAFATWYLQFAGIVFKFRDTFDRLVNSADGGPSTLSSYSSTVDSAQPEFLDLLRVALLKYGIDLIVVGLTALYVFFVVVGYLRRNRQGDGFTRAKLTFVAGSALFVALSAVLFVFSLPLDYSRPLLFGVYLGLVPAGLALGYLWHGPGWVDKLDRRSRSGEPASSSTPRARGLRRVAGRAIVVMAVLSIASLAVFGTLYSPLGSLENHQVTRMELDGTGWVFENRDTETEFATLGVSFERHHHAQFGVWTDVPFGEFDGPGVPDHFNYTEYPTLGASYTDDTYLTISELGRIVYPAKFPDYEDQWRWTPADFAALEHDPSVDHVYDNGEVDTYHVSGTGTTAAEADLTQPDRTDF